jgi:hypothetical protein
MWYVGLALSLVMTVSIYMEFGRFNFTTWDTAHVVYAGFAVLYVLLQGYVSYRSRPARWRREGI